MRNRALLAVPAVAIVACSALVASGGEERALVDPPPQRRLEKMDFGKTPDGTSVEKYVLSNGKMTVKVITYGAIVTEIDVPDRNGKIGRRRPRVRQPRRLPRRPSLFRRGDRARRQPDRQGKVHAGRQGVQARRQQRAQHAARRAQRLRQGRLESVRRIRTRGPAVKMSYLSPDGEEGFPGNLSVIDHVHGDCRQRAANRLHGDHRQGRRPSTSPTTVTSTSPGPPRARSWATN